MKNKIIKSTIMLAIFIIVMIIFANKSEAATMSVTISSNTTAVGSTAEITISSDCIGRVNLSASNGGQLSQNSVWVEGTQKVTLTVKNTGTTTVTVTPKTMSDTEGNAVTISAKSVSTRAEEKAKNNNSSTSNSNNNSSSTGSNSNNSSSSSSSSSNSSEKNNTKSSNANLKNLGIMPNDFSGFKASKTNYSVTVPNNVEKVKVYATAQDSNAKISGTGNISLKEGENSASVVVTAEDGTKKTYTISITREKEIASTNTNTTSQNSTTTNTNANTNITQNNISSNTTNSTTNEGEDEKNKKGIKSLNIEGLTLNSIFETDQYEYTTNIKENVEKLKLSIQTVNDGTKIHIKVNNLESEKTLTGNNVTIELETKDAITQRNNVLEIGITEKDGKVVQYKITIVDENKEEAKIESNDVKDNMTFMFVTFESIVVVILVILIALLVKSFKKDKSKDDIDDMELPKVYREEKMKVKEIKKQEKGNNTYNNIIDIENLDEKNNKNKGKHF